VTGDQCLYAVRQNWQNVVSYSTMEDCTSKKHIFGYNRKTGELISAYKYKPEEDQQINIVIHFDKEVEYWKKIQDGYYFGFPVYRWTKFYTDYDFFSHYYSPDASSSAKYFKRTSCEFCLYFVP